MSAELERLPAAMQECDPWGPADLPKWKAAVGGLANDECCGVREVGQDGRGLERR